MVMNWWGSQERRLDGFNNRHGFHCNNCVALHLHLGYVDGSILFHINWVGDGELGGVVAEDQLLPLLGHLLSRPAWWQ